MYIIEFQILFKSGNYQLTVGTIFLLELFNTLTICYYTKL